MDAIQSLNNFLKSNRDLQSVSLMNNSFCAMLPTAFMFPTHTRKNDWNQHDLSMNSHRHASYNLKYRIVKDHTTNVNKI